MSAVVAEGLGKRYRIGRAQHARALRDLLTAPFRPRSNESVWALRDASFEIRPGELVGIVGANGSGKTTLLKILSRITRPTEGRAEIRGRVRALLQVGTGFHPELTGRENVFYNGALLGMKKREIVARFDEIVAFSEIAAFIDTPVKYYSSGMYMRLAFAVAAHLEPEILLVDEVLAVGDAAFQRKCIGKMEEAGAAGRTVLYVSHNMAGVTRLCTRAILLREGRIVLDGPPSRVVGAYLTAGGEQPVERVWPDGAEPGDARFRLRAVRASAQELDIRAPLTIELEYRVLGDGERPFPKLAFLNQEGAYLFVSADTSGATRDAGLYRARVTVPGNFFAEGMVWVTPSVTTIRPTAVHARVADAIAFQVVDRSEGDGVRGPIEDDWPGLVRPLLGWTTERSGDGGVAP